MAVILVVEDDTISRELISTVIGNAGHIPLNCRNGQQALDLLRDNYKVIDMIITDIMMPEMDGHMLLNHIREDENFGDIPVIIQSAYLGEQALQSISTQGAFAILHKPIQLDRLGRAITDGLNANKDKWDL